MLDRFEARPKFLGDKRLNLVKVIAIVLMVFIHCRFFYSHYYKFAVDTRDSIGFWEMLYSLGGVLSLCIPIIAGQELYERTSPHLMGGHLINKNWLYQFLQLLLVVALIDPVKTFFAEGLVYAIRWNALPLICLSMSLVLLVLTKIGVSKLILFVPAVLLLTPVLTEVITPLALLTPEDYQWFVSSKFYPLVLLFFLILLFLVIQLVFPKAAKKGRSSLLPAAIFLLLGALFYRYWQLSPTFSATIFNLPLGALVYLGHGSGHLWPVFPWASLVFFGFYFQWVQDHWSERALMHWAVLSFATVFTWYLGDSFFQTYLKLVDAKTGYQSSVFSLPAEQFVFIFSFYTLFFYLQKVMSYFVVKDQIVIRLFGSGILIVYAVHYFLASRLAPVIGRMGFGLAGYFVYIFLVYALSLGLSGFIVYLYQSRIRIRLKRV